MTPQGAGVVLSAVHSYFDGERRELFAMLLGAVLLASATALLTFIVRDGFARGLLAVVLVFGVTFGAGAVALMVRDVGLRADLVTAMDRDPTHPASRAAIEREKDRIATVLSKFPIYRIAALVFAAVALVGLVLSRGGWVNGMATGLLLVAASQAVIDHYAERRATVYQERLGAARGT